MTVAITCVRLLVGFAGQFSPRAGEIRVDGMVLAVTLVAHRANETVLSANFYEDQLAAIGVFDAVHDEVLPAALDSYLADQEAKIPDNLQGVALPTDAGSQATMLEFARTALPPEYMEALTTDGIDGLIAYLRGERADIDWTVSLNEPLRAAFLTDSSGPSEFERTWSELGLGELAVSGLARMSDVPAIDSLRDPLSVPVLERLRAQGMPLEDAVALVTAVYESAPADPQIRTLLVSLTAPGQPLGIRQSAAYQIRNQADPAVVAALTALTDPSNPRNLRQAGLRYLAGRSDKGPATTTATRYLDDPDPLFAVSAVQTLARVGGAAGKVTLTQRLKVEQRVTVDDAIRGALEGK